VVQTGWLDLTRVSLPSGIQLDYVLLAPFLPHNWLFAHAGAIIHHGGISVTARALRQGCPMLIIPFRRDQLFHAALIRTLGVGTGMHPLKLTAAGVARMLSERVCLPSSISRAQTLSQAIRVEEGLAAACHFIEAQLSVRSADSR
jgi:sterol 3beta-glucosyltransferase